ncbi:MAG TPA: hypothetical protein VFD97_05680, partial [Acidimicrobiia bacterium]|nr:hypothetical protein [Acidimicrobiia bacterium]
PYESPMGGCWKETKWSPAATTRTLRTDRGLMIKNRDHWTIETIHPDHGATLTGRTGTIQLPTDYVAEHVELGYAQTSHATQGRTVDVALLLVDTSTDSRGVYTPMTRGRNANHAYIVTDENQTAVDILTQAITRDWIDQPAITRRTQLEIRQPSPPLWPSLQAHDDTIAKPDQEPTHGDSAGDDELAAEERRIRRLIDERVAAIQQRRRTIGRDQHTIGR